MYQFLKAPQTKYIRSFAGPKTTTPGHAEFARLSTDSSNLDALSTAYGPFTHSWEDLGGNQVAELASPLSA